MRESAERVFDEVLDRHLKGRPVELEALLAAHPELLEWEREELRTLTSTLEVSWVRGVLRPRGGALPEAIGSFRVLSRLGRGGQGEVYLAEDGGGRRLAVKLLEVPDREAGATVVALARLRRELELVRRIDHPGICKLHELGLHEGLPFVAMDLVEGQTLAAWIEDLRVRGVPPERADIVRALEIAEQTAHVLHVAHEAGVVHRDVKPGNIMLAADGRVVLLDFGLAKGLRLPDNVTQSGQFVGSPAFMAPELLDPHARKIDRRADVYSLGIALYECWTLRRPFVAADRHELFRRIRAGDPPAPQSFNPHLEERAQILLNRALACDRRHRYPTALALAQDLERLRLGQPLVARPPGWLQRTARRLGRQRKPIARLAGVLLLAASGLIALGAWRGLGRASRAASGHRMLTLASELLPTDPLLALRLALEGAERAPGLVASNTMLAVVGAQNERRWQQAHAAPLSRCLRGPGARTLVSAAQDGTVRVWDAETWDELRVLAGHSAPVCDLALDREGAWLASLDEDGECRLWSTSTWECTARVRLVPGSRRLPGFDRLGRLWTADDGGLHVWTVPEGTLLEDLVLPGRLVRCDLDPTGRLAVCRTEAGEVHLLALDPKPGRALEAPLNGAEPMVAAGFDPDGARLLLVARSGTASVLDLASGDSIPLRGLSDAGGAHAFAPQGGLLLVGRRNGRAGLWDARDGKRLRMLRGGTGPLHAAYFDEEGTHLLTCYADGTSRLWNPSSGEALEVYRGHPSAVVDAFFEPARASVVTAASDGVLCEWELASEAMRRTLLLERQDLVSAHFDPRGERVVCAGIGGWADILGLEPMRRELSLQLAQRDLHRVVFASDGNALLSASSDGTARLWSSADGTPLARLEHPAPVWDVHESPDGRFFLTAAEDGCARLWDARTGALVRELRGHEGGVRSARFLPDGRRALTCSESEWDASARLWDLESGRELAVLRAPDARPVSIAPDPSGRLALAGGWWGSSQLWDLAAGRLVRSWRAHETHIYTADVSPDGRLFLTASVVPVVRLWDAELGTERLTLRDVGSAQNQAEFSPDGRWVLTASMFGCIRLWPVDPIARARDLAPAALTSEERAQLGL